MVKNGFIHQNHTILCLNMENKYYGIEFGIEFGIEIRIEFGIEFGIGIYTKLKIDLKIYY